MSKTPCSNMNHGRLNVPIRYCPDCGKVVNSSAVVTCNQIKHVSLLKSRFCFCSACGKNLKTKIA